MQHNIYKPMFPPSEAGAHSSGVLAIVFCTDLNIGVLPSVFVTFPAMAFGRNPALALAMIWAGAQTSRRADDMLEARPDASP